MATQRTRQTHQQRVETIAAEAADKIAAESPVEERVVVTVEELPPAADTSAAGSDEPLGNAVQEVIGPYSPKRYMETMAALAEANVEFTQRVFDAQLRFATRMADAVLLRSR
jgi:hypothetical protein